MKAFIIYFTGGESANSIEVATKLRSVLEYAEQNVVEVVHLNDLEINGHIIAKLAAIPENCASQMSTFGKSLDKFCEELIKTCGKGNSLHFKDRFFTRVVLEGNPKTIAIVKTLTKDPDMETVAILKKHDLPNLIQYCRQICDNIKVFS